MKQLPYIFLISLLLLLSSCITQFIPQVSEDKEILVVEGLVTDQPEAYVINLSMSLPLGSKSTARPLKGCAVSISDNMGKSYSLKETSLGTYKTDPTIFQGIIGRFYTLHIKTSAAAGNLNYVSSALEMKPVPPIDSVYYEKKTIREKDMFNPTTEGCQIYLNTHDATNNCKFYRWEFSETWEFHLPYTVPNPICWISANSDMINIKNTTVLNEDRILRFPVSFISNETDRLRERYSMLVNQYSLNEEEYLYWEKLQTMSEQVGGLYDIIPSAIQSNVRCADNPGEKVLGFFSVSATTSKRIFINDNFMGLVNLYTNCIADTVFNGKPVPSLNISAWVIIDHPIPPPQYQVYTYSKGCYDCTVRGTNIEPLFWKSGK